MATVMVRLCDRCGGLVPPGDGRQIEVIGGEKDGGRFDLCHRCAVAVMGPLLRRKRALGRKRRAG